MIIVICLVGTRQVSTHCHVLLSVTITHPSMNQCVELNGFTYASPCNAGCTIRNLTDPDVSDFNDIKDVFIISIYVDCFYAESSFLDCGCVMQNTTQNMSTLHGSSNAMSLVDSSVVPEFCNRIKLCSLVAVMLTINED